MEKVYPSETSELSQIYHSFSKETWEIKPEKNFQLWKIQHQKSSRIAGGGGFIMWSLVRPAEGWGVKFCLTPVFSEYDKFVCGGLGGTDEKLSEY